MKRVMCIWFPNWPVQRRHVAQPALKSAPLVLHATSGGKTRVLACCPRAHRYGVKPGMLLAEAQALWPATHAIAARFEPHDASADRAALRQLADGCQQFSPYVAVEEAESPDCLLLDVT